MLAFRGCASLILPILGGIIVVDWVRLAKKVLITINALAFMWVTCAIFIWGGVMPIILSILLGHNVWECIKLFAHDYYEGVR